MRLPATAWLTWLLVANAGVEACSFSGAQEFKATRARMQAPDNSAETLVVERVNFIPAIHGMGSCEGTGLISVTVRLGNGGSGRLKRLGLLVSPSANGPDPAYLPDKPLRPYVDENGMASISWGWSSPPPADVDRYWRWRFTIQTIDRKGVLGLPVEVCAATDDSCAESAERTHPEKS